MLKMSRYLVVSDPVRARDTGDIHRVVLSTRSQQALVLSEALWLRIERNETDDVPPDTLQRLREVQVLVPVGADEFAEVIALARQAALSSTTLYECIQPSAACKLGCGYCGQQHSGASLSGEYQALLVQRVLRKLAVGGYRRLRVGWFGAEPLHGMAAMRALSVDLQAAAANHGCNYEAHLVTNGLALSPRVARELAGAMSVTEIEVTIDGPAEAHDMRRPTKGGAGTFQRIFGNLQAVAGACEGISLVVRCNVDRRNAAAVPGLIELLAAAGLQQRVRLYFAPVHDWGNGAGGLALSPEDYADREIEWLAQMAAHGFTPSLLPGPKPIVCMAVNPHAELIDPFGQVFNCTEVPLVTAYGVPNEYAMGTLATERDSELATRLTGFIDEVAAGQYGCPHCAMLPVCGGACPKQWQEGCVPCPSAKRNMKDRLVLAFALSRSTAATGHGQP